MPNDTSSITARTQKARGLQAIALFNREVFESLSPVMVFDKNDEELLRHLRDLHRRIGDADDWFLRPCPQTPRHGFVDSGPFDAMDITATFAKALELDPDPEFILMPKVDAKTSAIINDGSLTVGMGHAGATDGNGVRIPTPVMVCDRFFKKGIAEAAGITDSPYMETVFGWDSCTDRYVVQLRNGPALPMAQNFIPRKVTVKAVLTHAGDPDLVQWEKTIQEADPDSVVVSQTLADHYSVHAISRGIAVITDGRELAVGTELEPEDSVAGVSLPDLESRKYLQHCLAHYSALPCKLDRESVYGVMGCLHSIAVWDNDPALIRLRAWAIVQTLRHVTGACLAEMRHKASRMQRRVEGLRLSSVSGDDCSEMERESYYRDARFFSLEECERRLAQSVEGFGLPGWGDSFGGAKWKAAADTALRFLRKVKRFQQYTRDVDWVHAVELWNATVACVHNGNSTLLSKWTKQHRLNEIAETPALGLSGRRVIKAALAQGV